MGLCTLSCKTHSFGNSTQLKFLLSASPYQNNRLCWGGGGGGGTCPLVQAPSLDPPLLYTVIFFKVWGRRYYIIYFPLMKQWTYLGFFCYLGGVTHRALPLTDMPFQVNFDSTSPGTDFRLELFPLRWGILVSFSSSAY